MATLFPHLSSTETAPTARVILAAYVDYFQDGVNNGSIHPIVYPYYLWGVFILIFYLCIPHQNSPISHAARWPILAYITWFQWQLLWKCATINFGMGFVCGVFSILVILLAWTWLVFRDPQQDAKRVRRTKIQGGKPKYAGSDGTLMSSTNQNLRRRKPQSETIDFPASMQDIIADESYQYYWQSYPKNLQERIPWVVDLITNLKGVGWNWAISSLPAFPPEVLKSLGEPIPEESYTGISSVGVKVFHSRGQLLRSQIPRVLAAFLVLDTMVLLMIKDPFFKFGVTTFALPSYLQLLPLSVLKLYRQILVFCTIILSLYINSAMSAVVISGIFGPKIFGLSAEPWYYPSFWGSFSNVLEKGLEGLWGGFWHQTFRIVFTAPTRYLIKNNYVKPHSSAAILCSLTIAFCLSALLHWAGCIVFFIKTDSIYMALFFMLQPVGIMIQKALCAAVHPHLNKIPQNIRHAGNFLYVLTWLFFLSDLFIEEIVRGGTCLLPATPISIMQGLGISEAGSGWWSWPQLYVRWHTGDRWWTSGLTI